MGRINPIYFDMRKVLITGATGMIGGLVLQECLNSPEINQVITISRRTTGIQHKKLTEVITKDFMDYSDKLDHFKNVHAAYFCIGAYTGAVPDDEFKKITFGITKAFADALKSQSPKSIFSLLSGAGADRTEKSRISFAKYKGMAENYLLQLDFEAVYFFRPAYIYPVEKRNEPNFSYTIARWLYPLMNAIYPKGAIRSDVLAKAIFKSGITGAFQATLENEDIKKVAKS